MSWSPDGKTLAFVEVNNPDTQSDIWVLPLGQEPVPLLATAFLEHSPMFSPDGGWLAYVSDESGREEVYVRGFPGEGAKHPISTGGGREPVWSRDGRKLYFRNVDDTEMWAVAVEIEPTFQASRPELLFTRRFFVDANREQTYDVSPDGERFLMVEEIEDRRSQEVILVLNWSEDLKRLLPTE